jgi:hypothetical protein
MAQTQVHIVEGWLGPIDFQLLANGVAQNLTGLTVTGKAFNRINAMSDLDGDISIVSASSGYVRLTPDAIDFNAANSPYELRFWVANDTSGAGVVMFPNAEAISLIVRR